MPATKRWRTILTWTRFTSRRRIRSTKTTRILCLNAGKAVICEKPFALNEREAQEVIDVATEKGVFVMEAMWTRYTPAMVKIRELLAQGVIGEVRMVSADFGFRTEMNPQRAAV